MRHSSVAFRFVAAAALISAGAALAGGGRTPTFTEDVAPLLYERCVECHRPGGFAPFALLTYEDSAKRAELIRRVTINRQMPPTSGTSNFSTISLHPKLTDAELRMIQEWVREGSPEGPPERMPSVPKFQEGWRMGKPDLIVRIERPTPVRRSGNPYWRAYFVSVPEALLGRGLVGFDVRPASPMAVRHVLIGQDPYAASTLGGYGFPTAGSLNVPGELLVGAWAPGYRPLRLPSGAVLRLDPSPLMVQAHYAPTGKEEDGQIEIALYFGTGKETRIAKWMTLGKDEFKIEPEESLELSDAYVLGADVDVIAVHPEARMFADQVNVLATAKADETTLFHVYAWKIDWVGAYNFESPVRLRTGTRLTAKISYDNGRHAPANEDKEKPGLVTSGPTLMDEIFKVHILCVPVP